VKLCDYIKQNNLTQVEFGRRIGVARIQNINAIIRVRRDISADMMRRIYLATDGAVMPNDLVKLPPLPPKQP